MTTEPWKPAREVYEQNIGATEIRDVCLNALTTLESVLKVKDIVEGADIHDHPRRTYREVDLPDLYSKLEKIQVSLFEMGVIPNIHHDTDFTELDPLSLAEWVAGQLFEYLGPKIDEVSSDGVEVVMDLVYFYLDADIPEGF